MRALAYAAIVLFAAQPLLAAPVYDGRLACTLIDPSEMEALFGADIGPRKGQSTDACAGLCPWSNSSICHFPVLRRSALGQPESWSLWIAQPVFRAKTWPAIVGIFAEDGRRHGEEVSDVAWRNGSAFWDYDPAKGRGFLEIYVEHRVLLTVRQESGVRNSAGSLGMARSIAGRALAHLAAQ